MKHRVDKATFVTYGAMTPQLSERTGFNNVVDAETIKLILPRLFEGDASSALPEGALWYWEVRRREPVLKQRKAARKSRVIRGSVD